MVTGCAMPRGRTVPSAGSYVWTPSALTTAFSCVAPSGVPTVIGAGVGQVTSGVPFTTTRSPSTPAGRNGSSPRRLPAPHRRRCRCRLPTGIRPSAPQRPPGIAHGRSDWRAAQREHHGLPGDRRAGIRQGRRERRRAAVGARAASDQRRRHRAGDLQVSEHRAAAIPAGAARNAVNVPSSPCTTPA